MGLFGKKEVTSEYFKLLQELGKLGKNNTVKVELLDDHLELSNLMQKTPVKLNYSQITDVQYTSEIDVVEKSKSVIGRAIVGKVLFGNIGAQVGGMSGIGTKTKETKHFLFAISYTSSAGEESAILFEDTRMFHGVGLYKNLLAKCGMSNSSDREEITEL